MEKDNKKVIKVTGAIIQNENKFLICRRGPKEKAAGLWEFPGGKLEQYETLEACIQRELKEELEVDAVVGDLFDHYIYETSEIVYDLYFFKILRFKGSIKLTVHDKFKWVELKDFSQFNFLAGDGPVIKKLKKNERLSTQVN